MHCTYNCVHGWLEKMQIVRKMGTQKSSLKGFPGQSDDGTVHWTAKVVHFCSLISHHVCHIESHCSIHGEVILCSASRGLCLARSC
jgi:hypothetical protein